MAGEFALIDRHFGLRSGAAVGPGVPLGIGDDCAALRLSPGCLLLTSVDTFTEGIHFFAGTDAVSVGHKALAVNLSDLAACGARPVGCLLALSLPPSIDEAWIAGFAQGFLALAKTHACPLIGGDTTRSGIGGAVSVSVTVMGEVPDEAAILRRSGASVGDDIWVSGKLGAAALAVAVRREQALAPMQNGAMASAGFSALPVALRRSASVALDWPQPRLALGLALRGVASAAIDVSDGFLADLGHVLEASGNLGAMLEVDRLPLADVLSHLPDPQQRCDFACAGGDDYELCFTAPPFRRNTVEVLGQQLGLELLRVGTVRAQPGVFLEGNNPCGLKLPEKRGYEHF